MNFIERVAALCGASLPNPNAERLSQYLTDGARACIHALPEQDLWLVSESKEDTGAGVVLGNARLLYASVNGRAARLIPAAHKAVASDASSIHHATSFSPVFWLENGRAFVQGSQAGGTVTLVATPVVDAMDEAIPSFPDDLTTPVVYYAAAAALQVAAAALLAPDALAKIQAPASPSVTQYVVNAVSYSAPAAPTFPQPPVPGDVQLPTAPSAFVKPSVTLPATPTLAAFSLSATPPTPPAAPAYSYTDAASGAASATTITASPAAPVFTAPTLHADYESDLNAFDLRAADDDFEATVQFVNKVQQHLQQYQVSLQAAVAKFNEDVEAFRDKQTRAIEQARLDQERLVDDARRSDDAAKMNRAQQLQAAVQKYEAELRRYGAMVESYGVAVNAEVAVYQADVLQRQMALWQAECAHALQKYGTDVQAEAARVRGAVDAYVAELQGLVNEFQAQTGADVSVYSATVSALANQYQSAVAAAAQKVQAEVEIERLALQATAESNQSALARYQADLGRYQVEAADQVQRYEQELKKYELRRRSMMEDAQQLWTIFSQSLQLYTGAAFGGTK
jgi:hypothetical protein